MPVPNSCNDLPIADVVGFLATVNQLAEDRGWELSAAYLAENAEGTGSGFAHFLVRNAILTNYQAERISCGESGKLVLGPYLLQHPIGMGSLGTTFRATRRSDNRHFAIMMLPLRSMWHVHLAKKVVQSFAEFPGLSSVVPLADIDSANGYHYLAWPFVEGESLQSVVTRKGPLPLADGIRIATGAAEAFAFCRRYEITHGCLRPSKILLTPSGGVVILEWGVGAILSENIADDESFLDTISTATAVSQNLDCVPPEVIADPMKRTEFGDQYAFGCVLHFLFTGQYPFPDGNLVDKMIAHQTQKPVPLIERNRRIPQGLSDLIDRLLEKDPANRFLDWNEPLAALRQFSSVVPHGDPAPTAHQSVASPHKHIHDFIDSLPPTSRPLRLPTDQVSRSESQINFDFADSDGVTENSFGISDERRDGSTGEIPFISESNPTKKSEDIRPIYLKGKVNVDSPVPTQSQRTGLEKTDFALDLPKPIHESELASDFQTTDTAQSTSPESLISRMGKSVKGWIQSYWTKSEQLQVSLFGTPLSRAGQTIRLQAFVHPAKTFRSIKTVAKVFAPDAELLVTGSTEQFIPIGASLAIHLGVAQAGVAIPLVNFNYKGETQPKSFDVHIAWECPIGAITGVLSVARDQIRVARLSFEITIESRTTTLSISNPQRDSRLLRTK